MKAIRVEQFGEPEVMKLVEVPDLQPGPGEVLIRMHRDRLGAPFSADESRGQMGPGGGQYRLGIGQMAGLVFLTKRLVEVGSKE